MPTPSDATSRRQRIASKKRPQAAEKTATNADGQSGIVDAEKNRVTLASRDATPETASPTPGRQRVASVLRP